MTTTNKLTRQPVHAASIGKRMLQGASIAFLLIAFLLSGAGEPDPSWPKLWMLRPLLIVPAAGALGGAFYYFMDHLRHQGRWKKTLAIFISLIGYAIALWLGTILGLDGTLWD